MFTLWAVFRYFCGAHDICYLNCTDKITLVKTCASLSQQINGYNRNALCKDENYLDVIVIDISSIVRFETYYAH